MMIDRERQYGEMWMETILNRGSIRKCLNAENPTFSPKLKA